MLRLYPPTECRQLNVRACWVSSLMLSASGKKPNRYHTLQQVSHGPNWFDQIAGSQLSLKAHPNRHPVPASNIGGDASGWRRPFIFCKMPSSRCSGAIRRDCPNCSASLSASSTTMCTLGAKGSGDGIDISGGAGRVPSHLITIGCTASKLMPAAAKTCAAGLFPAAKIPSRRPSVPKIKN